MGHPAVELGPVAEPERIDALVDAIGAVLGPNGAADAVWCREATDHHDEAAGRLGLSRIREVHQMRSPLPLATDVDRGPAVTVRPFRPADAPAWLEVNNAAFAWHPDQGGWDEGRLATALAEPWVDLEGFLVHDDPDDRDRLDGFCWTREHRDTQPPLGEIYAIAAHPRVHRRGLGRALTVAGLDHLADRGLSTAMLYVEDTNHAARRLYEELGFSVHHVDRCYGRVAPGGQTAVPTARPIR